MFGIDGIYWVLINSVVSVIYLFMIAKFLGKKQIAQLEFIDYVIGISLGSIAAEMATDDQNPFYYYLIAMAIYFIFAYLLSIIGRKGTWLKRVVQGHPSMIIYEGKLNYDEVKKCKVDINDILAMLRSQGYFDINDVAFAVLETSGELSVMPKGNKRPVVIEDLNKKSEAAQITNYLIADGNISYSGLREINKDKEWLYKRLKIKSKKDLKQIFLCSYDPATDKFSVHKK